MKLHFMIFYMGNICAFYVLNNSMRRMLVKNQVN